MIEALVELGKYSLTQNDIPLEEPFRILVEDPASTDRYKHVFFVKFDAAQKWKYVGIEIEEYSKDKCDKYLYKKGAPNGIDFTPTSRVTALDKTLNNKLSKWFRETIQEDIVKEDSEGCSFLEKVYAEIDTNKAKILDDLREKLEYIDKKERLILSIKIENDSKGKYVGDFPIFKKILEKNGLEAYYKRYDTEAIAFDKVCSVCKTPTPEVYGFASTFAFYSVDKPGFVSGGFDQSLAWKNYPVCTNCALYLEEGRNFLERKLNFRMYNFRYFIIPKALLDKDTTFVFEIFEDYENKPPALRAQYGRIVQQNEEDTFDYLSEQGNFFNNNLLFYEAAKSAFRILLYVEDVLPSHLAKMFKAKRAVDARPQFKSFGKDSAGLLFTFGTLRHFFPDKEVSKYFLEIVNSIFTGKKVGYPFLIQWTMNKIWDDYAHVEGHHTKYSTFRGLQLLLFLNELHLLKGYEGGENLKDSAVLPDLEAHPVDVSVKKIFGEFYEFFNTDAKRAIFLEGVLTQLLLNVQYHERGGATPFTSKLNGLKVNERLVKKLLPEIENKFIEYGKHYYRRLERILSAYLLKAGNNWNMTTDEISFYFVLGMNLSEFIKGTEVSLEGESDE